MAYFIDLKNNRILVRPDQFDFRAAGAVRVSDDVATACKLTDSQQLTNGQVYALQNGLVAAYKKTLTVGTSGSTTTSGAPTTTASNSYPSYFIDEKLMRVVVQTYGSRPHAHLFVDYKLAVECGLVHGQVVSGHQLDALRKGSLSEYRAAASSRGASAHSSGANGGFTADLEVVGQNGHIRLRNGLIEIARGLKDDLLFGNLRGTKAIPIRSVQAVQFKRATRVPGAIEFVVAGDRSNTGMDRLQMGSTFGTLVAGRGLARAASENTVTFTRSQEPPFIRLHEHILSLIGITEQPMTPTTIAHAPADLVAQLEQLRGLLDAGVLTDAEFSQAKARLLNG